MGNEINYSQLEANLKDISISVRSEIYRLMELIIKGLLLEGDSFCGVYVEILLKNNEQFITKLKFIEEESIAISDSKEHIGLIPFLSIQKIKVINSNLVNLEYCS